MGLALAATALRLAIGVGLGGISGWKQSGLSQQILTLSAVSASVPSLLFAYLFIVSIGPQEGFGVFLFGLALTGWAELTNLVNGAIAWIKAQPYMEGARTLGSSPGHLIRRHVFPNLAPQLLPAFALELSAAMLILAELGFIGIVFGERAPTSIPQSLRVVQAAEWGGMLSGSRLLLFNKPWLPSCRPWRSWWRSSASTCSESASGAGWTRTARRSVLSAGSDGARWLPSRQWDSAVVGVLVGGSRSTQLHTGRTRYSPENGVTLSAESPGAARAEGRGERYAGSPLVVEEVSELLRAAGMA